MQAKELVECLKQVTQIVANSAKLQVPTSPAACVVDGPAIEQVHRVTARVDGKKLLLDKSEDGRGYWIPYLGERTSPEGVIPGFGTYTPSIESASEIEWVVAGPFSGCHAVVFESEGRMVFAHVVKPGKPYRADTVENQTKYIAGKTNTGVRSDLELPHDKGPAYVFWIRLDKSWYQYVVQVLNNEFQCCSDMEVV